MLILADIPRFNWRKNHPWFNKNIYDLLINDRLVVTLDDVPVSHVFAWSVPDNYIKRHIDEEEMKYRINLSRNAVSRFKGKVMVFRVMEPLSSN